MDNNLLKAMRNEADIATKTLAIAKDDFEKALSDLTTAHAELAAIEERIRIAARINPRINDQSLEV